MYSKNYDFTFKHIVASKLELGWKVPKANVTYGQLHNDEDKIACVLVCMRVCVCVWERDWESERVGECVCVRERERVCERVEVRVCVCEREIVEKLSLNIS